MDEWPILLVISVWPLLHACQLVSAAVFALRTPIGRDDRSVRAVGWTTFATLPALFQCGFAVALITGLPVPGFFRAWISVWIVLFPLVPLGAIACVCLMVYPKIPLRPNGAWALAARLCALSVTQIAFFMLGEMRPTV